MIREGWRAQSTTPLPPPTHTYTWNVVGTSQTKRQDIQSCKEHLVPILGLFKEAIICNWLHRTRCFLRSSLDPQTFWQLHAWIQNSPLSEPYHGLHDPSPHTHTVFLYDIFEQCNRDSSVSMATRPRAGWPRFNSRRGNDGILFSSLLRPDRLWGPPSLLSNG
jgi:hypothetical protein